MKFMTVRVSDSKFEIKCVNAEKSTTQQVRVFNSNRMFGTKRSKINRLLKTIKYKTNEQSKNNGIEIWKK